MLPLPDGVPWPPHAHVPGQNARHAENWFDGIKATVISNTQIESSDAWRVGLAYLDAGYSWECHEVLEAVWFALPNPSPQRDMTQAIIQLANARLKLRMGKPRATLRLCKIVQDILEPHGGTILEVRVKNIVTQSQMTAQDGRDMQ